MIFILSMLIQTGNPPTIPCFIRLAALRHQTKIERFAKWLKAQGKESELDRLIRENQALIRLTNRQMGEK